MAPWMRPNIGKLQGKGGGSRDARGQRFTPWPPRPHRPNTLDASAGGRAPGGGSEGTVSDRAERDIAPLVPSLEVEFLSETGPIKSRIVNEEPA